MCVLCGALWTEQHWAEVAAVEQLDTHERMRRMSRYLRPSMSEEPSRT